MVFESPTLYSPDVMGDAPWQDGCSEDDQASKILFPAAIVFMVFVV